MSRGVVASKVANFDLSSLEKGLPGVTPLLAMAYAEAAAICLEHNKHVNTFQLHITGDHTDGPMMTSVKVTAQMRRCHADLQEATEFGACAIAFLIVRECTKHTVIERSFKGTGFDYWLGEKGGLFQKKAKLEVSGILKGTPKKVDQRLREKTSQSKTGGIKVPGVVVVVEFGRPEGRFISHG
jgi:hypothetical protein